MNRVRSLLAVALAGACVFAAVPPPKKKTSTKKSASKRTAATTGSKKTAARKTATKKSTKQASWRNTQRTPTPERYKEIQQALASKGYLAPTSSTGVWDASSVEALKKFQADQSLEPSGKIDSLSLIALGLGPKREQAASAAPPPTP